MLPSALGFGEGSEFRAPMAVAVIGGIISSTFLTLVVVPAMYTLVDDFQGWLARYFGGLLNLGRRRAVAGTPTSGAID